MSVDGALLTDVRQLRSHPGFVTLAVTGPRGCGKSFTLRQVIKSLTETKQYVCVPGLEQCLCAPDTASDEARPTAGNRPNSGTDTSTPTPTPPTSPLPLLIVRPDTVKASSPGNFVNADGDLLQLSSGTLVIMDDVEALWSLSRMNNTVHLLQRLYLLAQRGTGCRVVFSATDEGSIPHFFRRDGRVLVYEMPALTSAAVRRTVRSISTTAPAFSIFEDCGDVLRPSTSRRSLLLSMTMSMHPSQDAVIHEAPCTVLARHLRGLEGSNTDIFTPSEVPTLFGLEPVLSRLGMLVSVFATGSAGASGGKLMHSLRSTTGVLLHGPSGCGKSAVAREVARRYPHIPFTVVTCTDLFSKYLGESEEKLRDVYRAARASAPSVVVLDDVDVLAQSRQGGGEGNKSSVSVSRRMLACLLCELDGIADNSGVLTIATTNAPHVLDSALLRQGRLETLMSVPPLSSEAALEMSRAFFATFRQPDLPVPSTATDEVESLSHPTACSRPPCPQQSSVVETVAAAGAGCAATSMRYLFRKILECHLTECLASSTSHELEELPAPSSACVQACLFECASVLMRVQYVDPFTT